MAVTNNLKPIAITVAVRREAEAVLEKLSVKDINIINGQKFFKCLFSHREIIVAVLGIGTQKTVQGVNTIIKKYSPSVIISLGFAGAVDAMLKRGNVILGNEVFFESNTEMSFSSDPILLNLSEKALSAASIPYYTGRIYTVLNPLFGDKDKMIFRQQHQCLAVEMETAAVAEIASREGLPFLSIRFILDEVRDDLKFVFNYIKKNGRLSFMLLGKNFLSSPKIIRNYIKLRNCWAVSCKSIQTAINPVLKETVKEF
jgi:adenosylhomocysteine nucleosidase